MRPHENNFCSIHGSNWLDVMLTPLCNGKCSWCIERNGYHSHNPVLSVAELSHRIIKTKKDNIQLLGGEPTLYSDLDTLIMQLIAVDKKVCMTTNGTNLNMNYPIMQSLKYLTNINISIHHWTLNKNTQITGIPLNEHVLKECITFFKKHNVHVRFNCNLISGYVDNKQAIEEYVIFAKNMDVDSVRFAELKNVSQDEFIDLTTIYPSNTFGINMDPYTFGCNHSGMIYNLPISFKQMCGIQAPLSGRPIPSNPEQQNRLVLYYDGLLSDGWINNNTTIKPVYTDETDEINALYNKIREQSVVIQQKNNEIASLNRDLINNQRGCGY